MGREYNVIKVIGIQDDIEIELPAVMTIAGSDSSGGAGIEADLKTFTAHGVYGLTCIVALTAQNTQGVRKIQIVPRETIREILQANFADLIFGHEVPPLKVIKTGMLTAAAIDELAGYLPLLREKDIKLVCDPVMISTSGNTLIPPESVQMCLDKLFHGVYLLTPNFKEALSLYKLAKGEELDLNDFSTLDYFVNFVIDLQRALGCENILVKGGHIIWDSKEGKPSDNQIYDGETDNNTVIIDILYESQTKKVSVHESPYLRTKNSHGTGCTLAAAIAAQLSKGMKLNQAVPLSINFVHRAMVSLKNKLGHGNGPLNHTISPKRLQEVTDTKKIQKVLDASIHGDSPIIESFKNHPSVVEAWERYIHHDFVKQIALNSLPFDKFFYFLEQDYYYLLNYAQVHSLASAVAPNYQYIRSQANIVLEVIQEIEKHREKLLANYGVEYDSEMNPKTNPKPGKACLDYCNYLLHIARTEDFLGIKVAMSPCLNGYKEAADFGKYIRSFGPPPDSQNDDVSAIYASWLDDYTSDWYVEANRSGLQDLDNLFKMYQVDGERFNHLVGIFRRVTELEGEFWDEVLKHQST